MSRFFDGLAAPEPSAILGFSGNRIDRRSENRAADAVPAALADANARLYLFRGDTPLMRGGDPLFTPREAEALGADFGEAILLGWNDRHPRLAAALGETTAIDESAIALPDLRSLAVAGALSPEHLGAMAQARSLIAWHERRRFCGHCGTPTVPANGGYRRDCPNCGGQHFPRTDPVVIMLAIHTGPEGERALLGRQPRFQPGMYSCLAGFMEPGETIEDAVRRETREEAGIAIGRVAYHASQPWPFPSSLMIGCHAEALSEAIVRDETELEDCRWFSRDEVRAMLAGTHPDSLITPPPMAIANRLVAAWAEPEA